MSQRAESENVKQVKARVMVLAIIVTAAIAVAIAGAGVALSFVNGSSQAVAQAQAVSSIAQPAPSQQIQVAAPAIDFQPTRELDVGQVEGLPAGAVHDGDNPNLLAEGGLAPDFNLPSVTGQRVRLSDLRGKAVLLEFFATWCPHCQAEASHLKSILGSLPVSRFAMLQVTADSEDAASLLAFDTYYGITTPALLDSGRVSGNVYHQGSSGPVTLRYRVAAYPTFYVIDTKGHIAWRADHEQPDALILQKLKDASGS
jgi:peroxiredoxin